MLMKTYRRISRYARDRIAVFHAVGKSVRYIAKMQRRSPSTISRELRRLTSFTQYSVQYAELHYQSRKKRNIFYKLEKNPRLAHYVKSKLVLRWSPEQIAFRIRKDHRQDQAMRISYEAIYRWVYYLDFVHNNHRYSACLRRRRKQRYTKYSILLNRLDFGQYSIRKRPKEVQTRETPGHWGGIWLPEESFRVP